MALNPTNTPSTNLPSTKKAAAEDDVLIREIDDAVRQDDALAFIQRYGIAVLAGIILLIAGLAAYMWYDSTQESALEQQSETLITGLDHADQRDFDTASERAETLLADGTPGARTAARFLQAGAALEQDQTARATELYAAIIADTEAPAALRDVALIRKVTLQFDTMQPADVIAQLSGLAVPDSPFFGSAGELVAMAHLESGNQAEAGRIFAAIAKDEAQPETLRSRSRQMAGLLGVDAIDDVNKLLEDEGVDVAGQE